MATVIVTVFPASPAVGVYVKSNGDMPDDAGFTVPAPFSVIVTVVALVNVFPLIVTGVMPQVLPLILLSVRAGAFVHPHDTKKLLPVVAHPEAFLTVIEWFPFTTPVNITLV